MRFKFALLSFIYLFSSILFSQNVDSLISILPKLKGKEKVQTLADIGYYLSTNRIDEAIYYGNLSVAAAEELKDSSMIGSCINDLSLSYYFKGNFDSCIFLAEKAYKIRLKLGELRNAGASLSKAAIGYYEKGKYEVSLQKNLESLDLFKKSNANIEAAKLQNNIGSIYERNNQLDKAMEMYYNSAQFALKAGDIDGYTTAKCNYGIILRKKGKVEESVKLYLSLLDTCKQYCREEYLSTIYQQLGVAERHLGNTQKGLNYYLMAKEIYDRVGSLSGSSIINVNIGNCYADIKQFDKAEEFLKLGLEQSLQIKSWLWQKNAFFGLYDLERLRGNFEKANEYLEWYQQVNDSLYSEQTREGLIELQTKYDLAEKERIILDQKYTIAESELNISKRNTQLVILGCILLLFVMGGFIFTQRNKLKRKEASRKYLQKVQDERTRISRDLHDNMGAELTIISSQLDIKASGVTNKKDQVDIEQISDQVRKASALMRDTIWTVSTEKISLEQFGLKIKEFAERTFSSTSIKLHFENTNAQIILSPEHTLNLFRICQEIINNAFKHSQCNNFYVKIFPANNKLIELKDDGVGFNIKEIEKGYGLDNLNVRTSDMNAKLETITEKDRGTTYKIYLENVVFESN